MLADSTFAIALRRRIRFLRIFFVCCFFPVSLLGGNEAVIVLPPEPNSIEVEAAEELAHYWERLSTQSVTIHSEEEVKLPAPRLKYHRFGAWRRKEDRVVFVVGDTRFGQSLTRSLDEMKADSVALVSRRNVVVLRGNTPWATRAAVYRFLHHSGIRWYMPEKIGEHVPENTLSSAPQLNVFEEPVFESRVLTIPYRHDDGDWERRALLRARLNFNHNIHRTFTAEVYDSRPDFFILLAGERKRPDPALGGENHQICYGNPDAAIFAARKAAEFFDEHPKETSFSLGMTDTIPICECSFCQNLVEGTGVFRGKPDYSDLIFTFMNRVAEELEATHPEKYVGCLAYYWAENTPSFPVHPNVIPYLTADRFQWHDDDFRSEDKALIQRWKHAGPRKVGIYDYYFGPSFAIPRVAPSIVGESIQYAADEGVEGFYAQTGGANWTLDGPKLWLASQLLWDAGQDHQALLDDYYENFFGDAATAMRAFFNRSEELWMGQGQPTQWLKFYHDFSQFELFPPEVCRELRGYLNEAAGRADTDLVRERVRLFSEGFRLTELYAEIYDTAKRLGDLASTDLADSLGRWTLTKEKIENHYDEVINPQPLHRPRRRIEERARFLPGMKAAAAMAVLYESAKNGNIPFEEIDVLATKLDETFPESRAALVVDMQKAVREGDTIEVLLNGDFRLDELFLEPETEDLFPFDYIPYGWEHWGGETGQRAMELSNETAAVGSLSLRAQGVVKEALFQRYKTQPGERFLFRTDAKGRVSPGSRVEIAMKWFSAGGEIINTEFLDLDPLLPGEYPDWTQLSLYAEAPPAASVGLASLVVYHQAEDDYVFFDNIHLKRVEVGNR